MAVVIVGFRNPGDVRACLAALAKSSYPDFEVAICENGGQQAFDNLRAVLHDHLPGGQPIRIVAADRNLGFAGGVNLAMGLAPQADAWWILNPDTEAAPDALGHCVARLSRGDCEAVGCVLFTPDGRVQSYGGRWQVGMARALSLGNGAQLSAPVDAAIVERSQSYLNGAAMLIGRRFRETAGDMREDYFLYCEEIEWCLRARRMGMRLGFAPEAQVLHHVGATTGAGMSFRQMPKTPVYLNVRNRILMTRDLWPNLTLLIALTSLVATLARFARRGAWRQIGFAVDGWFAGLRDARGPPDWIPLNPN